MENRMEIPRRPYNKQSYLSFDVQEGTEISQESNGGSAALVMEGDLET